jgi:hypothetical protein
LQIVTPPTNSSARIWVLSAVVTIYWIGSRLAKCAQPRTYHRTSSRSAQNRDGLAGIAAAINYLADLGCEFGARVAERQNGISFCYPLAFY